MALDLRTWRLIKKYSVKEMAEACNVHENTYRAWEKDPHNIRLEHASKLASKLDISIEEISLL